MFLLSILIHTELALIELASGLKDPIDVEINSE
jgi:hypothetical protein